jgi:hypothetical protein
MALEFALRPRINLERPTPSRRRTRSPRFVLLVITYWLAVAGGTTALLRVLKSPPGEAVAEAAEANLAVAAPEEPASEEPASEQSALAPELAASSASAASESSPAVAAQGAASPDDAVASNLGAGTPAEPAPAPEPRAAAFAPAAAPRDSDADVRERPRAEARAPKRAEPRESKRAEPPPPKRAEPPPLEAFELAPSAAPTRALRDDTPRPDVGPTSLPSCETAAASASETLDLGGAARAPDLPREAFAAVLDNGAYLARCALPARTTVEVCAAVRDGKVSRRREREHHAARSRAERLRASRGCWTALSEKPSSRRHTHAVRRSALNTARLRSVPRVTSSLQVLAWSGCAELTADSESRSSGGNVRTSPKMHMSRLSRRGVADALKSVSPELEDFRAHHLSSSLCFGRCNSRGRFRL